MLCDKSHPFTIVQQNTEYSLSRTAILFSFSPLYMWCLFSYQSFCIELSDGTSDGASGIETCALSNMMNSDSDANEIFVIP